MITNFKVFYENNKKCDITQANNSKLYIIFGLPGAGKGVCAQTLKRKKDFMHLSLGEFLRKQVRAGTKLGLLYENYINGGLHLLPSETVWQIVRNEINASIDSKKDLIIDGFPRTSKQLKFLRKFVSERCIKPIYFFFDVEPDLAIARLLTRKTCSDCSYDYINVSSKKPWVCDLCQGKLLERSTDNKDTIIKRIEFFYRTTNRVLNILRKDEQLITLDTNKDFNTLVDELLDIMKVLV